MRLMWCQQCEKVANQMKVLRPFVGGNHKMVGSKASLAELVEKLRAGLGERRDVDVVIAPPTVYLETARQAVAGSPLRLSGQNCHEKPSGAFTGETSVEMLRDVGCEWVILGHSERRHVFGEQDAQLTLKVAAALKGGLGVVACVGETLAEREAGRTNEVVLRQLGAFAAGIGAWHGQDGHAGHGAGSARRDPPRSAPARRSRGRADDSHHLRRQRERGELHSAGGRARY